MTWLEKNRKFLLMLLAQSIAFCLMMALGYGGNGAASTAGLLVGIAFYMGWKAPE